MRTTTSRAKGPPACQGREEPYRFVSLAKPRRDFEADIRKYGDGNETKIDVVERPSDALDRFEHAWRLGVAGKTRSPEIRLTFESLPVLLKNLTPARWTLLEAVKRSGPLSINELARLLERNYKNVHTDVSRLMELGLIGRLQDQRVGNHRVVLGVGVLLDVQVPLHRAAGV